MDLRKVALIIFGSCLLWFLLSVADPENIIFTVLFFLSIFAGGILLYAGQQAARRPGPSKPTVNNVDSAQRAGDRGKPPGGSAGQIRQIADEVINGQYRLIRELKRGGMSVIWLADDLKLKDKCVIKIPRFDTPHNPVINEEKINIEANLLRQMKHGHIVGYRDLFRLNGVSHLVIEYIEGDDLFAKVNKTKVDEKRAVSWCDQILDALEYIHSFKLVHRDINPWNIMVRLSNDDLVIVDFGTTKTTSIDGATMVTKSGFEIPEQASRGYADERSDIYGAGSVLFYMVTATPPGLINTHNIQKLLMEHYSVSAKLAKCIEQSLQLDASKRFQGARAMRAALKSAVGDDDF